MISIITCPRPAGVKYLHPLLAVINEVCPTERRFVFCDGSAEFWPGWCSESFEFVEKNGLPDNKYVGWKALEKAERLGEDLLFLEDDVRPASSSSLLAALAHEVPSECGYASLHRSRWTTYGIHDSSKFMMSQAVKIPARSLHHLVSWRRSYSGDWEAITGFDVALAVAGSNARWKYEQTERNYFDLVGEVSAVHNGADGRSIAL